MPSSTYADTFSLHVPVRKSVRAAYMLWFVLGYVGAHRYYVDRKASAVAMPTLFVVATLATTYTPLGGLGLVGLLMWALADAVLIPGWVRDHNDSQG
jgi:hypothetical protein